MTRSIPLEKMLKDAFIAYGQNGEATPSRTGLSASSGAAGL